MRMRKKPNLIPRMEACAALWVREPEQLRGNWRSLKPDAGLVRLELGQGPFHRRHRRRPPVGPVHCRGAGAGRHGHGHGAV